MKCVCLVWFCWRKLTSRSAGTNYKLQQLERERSGGQMAWRSVGDFLFVTGLKYFLSYLGKNIRGWQKEKVLGRESLWTRWKAFLVVLFCFSEVWMIKFGCSSWLALKRWGGKVSESCRGFWSLCSPNILLLGRRLTEDLHLGPLLVCWIFVYHFVFWIWESVD